MRLLFLLVLTACQLTPAAAQDGLFPAFDARSRFLGGSGLNAEGINSLWTNPAGLARTGKQVEAAATAEQRFGLSDLTVATIGAAYQLGLGGAGVQFGSFGFDAYRETRIGLAYGRQLSDKFSIGAEFAGFATSTEGYSSTFDVTFGLGAQVQIIKELSVAARAFSPIRTERLPDEYLPQLLALGLTYQPTGQLLINAEVHQSTDHPARFRGGLEYLPVEQLSLRLGVATSTTELSFGAGYTVLEKLELNAGAVWHEVLGVWPAVGISWK